MKVRIKKGFKIQVLGKKYLLDMGRQTNKKKNIEKKSISRSIWIEIILYAIFCITTYGNIS